MTAGTAATLAVVVAKSLSKAVSKVAQSAGYGFSALSAALAIFLVYNIFSGGNPPPSAAAKNVANVSDASEKDSK